MNNKEYRRYRSLVRKKLETLGIKDHSTPVLVAKKRMLTINPKTLAPEVVEVPRYTLQNLNRRMVNQIVKRDGGTAMIDAFLGMDPSQLEGLKAAGANG
jgi:hypothetical protein